MLRRIDRWPALAHTIINHQAAGEPAVCARLDVLIRRIRKNGIIPE